VPVPLTSQQVRWVDPAELDAYPFPAANARIIAALRERLGVAGSLADSHSGESRPAP
jgi:A/G-specific adenine glycosylase